MKKRYIIAITVLVTLVIAGLTAWIAYGIISTAHEKEVAALKTEIVALKQHAAQLQDQCTQLQKNVTKEKNQSAQLKNQCEQLQNERANIEKSAYEKGLRHKEKQLTPCKVEVVDGVQITYSDGTGYYLEPEQVVINKTGKEYSK